MVNSSELELNELNKRTKNILGLMQEILDISRKSGKGVVIGSGLGLDIEAAFLRGDDRLTRNHGDLDIYPMEDDVGFWKEWFSNKGYTVSGNDEIKDETKAFVAFPPNFNEEKWGTDPESFYIDMYGIMVDENGLIHSRESGEDDNWQSRWDDIL